MQELKKINIILIFFFFLCELLTYVKNKFYVTQNRKNYCSY